VRITESAQWVSLPTQKHILCPCLGGQRSTQNIHWDTRQTRTNIILDNTSCLSWHTSRLSTLFYHEMIYLLLGSRSRDSLECPCQQRYRKSVRFGCG
jgi:hypothetical protein